MKENLKSTNKINSAYRKGRNAYFAIANIRTENINPLAILKLYKTVVIPTCLYGCEFWYGLRNHDIKHLNRLQHFIAKDMQRFHPRTRSDMCESMLGLNPLICEVEKRKLYLFGKFCRMETASLPKKMFLLRLFTCFPNVNSSHGFIPDILHIVQKYHLCQHLESYFSSGDFPSKSNWKKIVTLAINSTQQGLWQTRITSDRDFSRFHQIHSSVAVANIWKWPPSTSELRTSFLIAKLIVTIPTSYNNDCKLCHKSFSDVMMHSSCECPFTANQRDTFFELIIENFHLDLYVELSCYDSTSLYCVLLGKAPSTDFEDFGLSEFRALCFTHVIRAAAEYNRMLKSIL